MTLQEVLIGAVILAILSPIVHKTYTFSLRTQRRRAVQEEILIFASDYLEYQKLQLLYTTSDPNTEEPFDTLRIFRGDTLFLEKSHNTYETENLKEETISIRYKSDTLITLKTLVKESESESLWN